jgi:hypothetical protein
MTTLAFVGGASPGVTASFTDRWVQSASGVALPTTARVADNGNRPVYVSTAQFFVAGRGGSRTVVVSVGGFGNALNLGSAGSAVATGNVAINGIFVNGGTQVVRLEASPTGSYYFGRATGSSGAVDYYGTNFGALSGQVEYYEVPTAPTAITVAQAGLENAVNVSWTAPSNNGGAAVDTYKVKWSYNSNMSGATVIGTGSNATTYKVTGLSYGAIVYVQVSAVNVVASAAGTSSVYSSAANAYITAPNLPLNGWANFGTVTNTTFELSNTVIPALIPETGIQRKATSSVIGGAYVIGTTGITKTYTDLIIGRQYIMSGKAILLSASPPGNIYRFAVTGIGNGTSVTLTSTTAGATIPSYTFTATATTHVVEIELAEAFAVTTVGIQENVAFYDFALTRVANDLVYRLQDNDENSTLTQHFDLATQSVGAYWWVDKLNTTQFTQDFDYVFPSATFSDVVADGNIYYSDIKTSYDTSAVINDITFENVGRRLSAAGTGSFDAYSVAWNERDTTSVNNWGARNYELTTNLRTPVSRINILPNPNMAYTGDFTGSSFGSTITQRRPLSTIVDGATGNLPVGTTQPVTNAGDFVIQAARTSTAGAFGSSVQFGGPELATDGYETFPVTPSTQYTFSFYGRTGVGHTASVTVRADVYWFGSSGAYLGVSANISGQSVNSTSWTRYSLTATAPANAYYARVEGQFAYVGANNANFKYYATCAQMEAASTASTWFSGDTIDNATHVYEWEGTPGSSRSIRYDNVMDTRTGELLTEFANPAVLVKSLTWNTAQNPILATNLDIGKTITITFNGTTGLYRVAGISHDINTTRWMMTLQVAKV